MTKKKRSAIIASLLVTNKAKVENHVEFCPPKSLETWKKKKGKDGTENIHFEEDADFEWSKHHSIQPIRDPADSH